MHGPPKKRKPAPGAGLGKRVVLDCVVHCARSWMEHAVGNGVDRWNGSNAAFSTTCRFRLGTPGSPVAASNERCHRHCGRVVVFHGRGCRHVPGRSGPSLAGRLEALSRDRRRADADRLPAQCGRCRTGCIVAGTLDRRHRSGRAPARRQLASCDRGSPGAGSIIQRMTVRPSPDAEAARSAYRALRDRIRDVIREAGNPSRRVLRETRKSRSKRASAVWRLCCRTALAAMRQGSMSKDGVVRIRSTCTTRSIHVLASSSGR